MSFADVVTMARHIVVHGDAGRDEGDPRVLTDLETLNTDVEAVLDAIHPPATEEERLSFLVRELVRQGQRQEILVADISALQAAVDKLGADATADHDAIVTAFTDAKTAIDALTAQVAALTAGTIDQATIDALTTAAEAADTSINDAAAAVVPVVTP